MRLLYSSDILTRCDSVSVY